MFVPVIAYHSCLNLPATFSQPRTKTSAHLCISAISLDIVLNEANFELVVDLSMCDVIGIGSEGPVARTEWGGDKNGLPCVPVQIRSNGDWQWDKR